jgi:hypothetical protein
MLDDFRDWHIASFCGVQYFDRFRSKPDIE